MRKKFLFMFLAFAFVIGCQGQYPETEVVEPIMAHEVEMCLEEDSVRMVIMYHPLDKGVKYGAKGYQPNYKAFYMLDEFKITTWRGEGVRLCSEDYMLHVNRFYKHLIDGEVDYKCGFYQIRIYKYGARKQELTRHFTKCNPNYLRN